MQYLSLAGLYWSGGKKIVSGIQYSTQPTDIPLGALAFENERTYEFMRISGTCTVGDSLYLTGTSLEYVIKSGTNAGKPYGFAMVSPTASGVWTWIQKKGINTSLQITGTVSMSGGSSPLYGGVGSALGNISNYLSGIASGAVVCGLIEVGKSLADATGSQTIGYINVL